jgi:uncharacterized membrane protein
MTSLKDSFLKGLMVVLPLFLLVIALIGIFNMISDLTAPLADFIPKGALLGVSFSRLLVFILLIIIVYLMGILFLRLGYSEKINKAIGLIFPGYLMMQGMLNETVSGEETFTPKPCLAFTDDGWAFSFIVEELEDDFFIVFVPNAPNPSSGMLVIKSMKFMRLLDLTMTDQVKLLSVLGKGGKEILKGKLDLESLKS